MAVQLIERTVGAGAGVHIDHAQLSARMGWVAGNGRVLRQRAFTTGEEQQAPAQFGPALTLAGHGAFALAVGQ